MLTNFRKRKMALILLSVMLISLFSGIPTGTISCVRAETILNNPGMDSDGVTTWDCIYFGNYYQSQYAPIEIPDNVIDDGIYTDSNGQQFICNIDGNGAVEYFKYEPIKWRILSVENNIAILMADCNLDIRSYHEEVAEVSWHTCTLRSWLNGYTAADNSCELDFADNNFLNRAFTTEEQNAIVVEDVENGDYGEEDFTKDRIYCLSYNDVVNNNYGFNAGNAAGITNGAARVATNTAYVASGGVANVDTNSVNAVGEGQFWWLRSPARGGIVSRCVWFNGWIHFEDEEGEVEGCGVQSKNVAVRPAITLDLSNTDIWSYAGTVNSDGEKTEPNEEEFSTSLKEPVIKDTSLSRGNITVWDCIWFGKYPQAEIVNTELSRQYEAVERTYLQPNDLIVSDDIYEKLVNEGNWDSNDNVTIDGDMYCRLKKDDAIDLHQYEWSDATTYHYFKYEPIKWRVLSINGKKALVVSDLMLDNRYYNENVYFPKNSSGSWIDGSSVNWVYWSNSSLRSWLNGYDSTTNIENIDHSGKGFYDLAFTDQERGIITTTTLDNSARDSDSESTRDKVFVLSDNDLKNEEYGFTSVFHGNYVDIETNSSVYGGYIPDSARCSRSSTFAKAMGCSYRGAPYLGNGSWWSRSSNGAMATEINWQGKCLNGYEGEEVWLDCAYGIRPAMTIDISATEQWQYAGTVSSEEYMQSSTDNDSSQTDNYTSTDGICSAEHLSALLGQEDFRAYTSTIRNIEMVIPGIKQTNMGDGSVCKNMVTQGLCVTNQYVLISAYCKDKKHNSVIYVMDANTKEYLTTILLSVEDNAGLKDGNHVGGLAYGNDTIYIAGSDENKVWKLPYEAVYYAVVAGKDTYEATISKNAYIKTGIASYIYWDDCYKELFVGRFDEDEVEKNYMKAYNVDTGEGRDIKIQLPMHTQGVTFAVGADNKTYCICSKSLGRTNSSRIYVAELKKRRDNGGYELTNWHGIVTPNMSEDIQVWNGTVYNCFESAADFYRYDDDSKLRSTVLDRIPYINTRALLNVVMTSDPNKNQPEIARYGALVSKEHETPSTNIILEGACGDNVNYCLYEDGSIVISGQGAMENYSENTMPWYDYLDSVTSVYIDSGVSGIGEYAFYNCSNLETVTVSEYMNTGISLSVGAYAFGGCAKLNKVALPDVACDINENAFDEMANIQLCSDSDSVAAYCEQLDNMSLHKHEMEYAATVDATCMEIGYDSYICECGCEEIANVVEVSKEHNFKEAVRKEATKDEEGYIEYQCSECLEIYCEILEYTEENVTTPDDPESSEQPTTQQPKPEQPTTQQPGETEILPVVGTITTLSSGSYKVTKSTASAKEVTFVKPKNSKKTSVSIPATVKLDGYTYKVTEIASKAFKNNKKLKSVTIGKNVKKIGNEAFSGCKNLKKVTIGKKVTTIGKKAFYNCKKLKTITIKSTVLKSVGKNAIKNIDKKATIKVPKSKLKKYKSLFKSKTGYKKTMKIKK